MKITPVILCGGSGTRLWPLSRHSFPKQFISLKTQLSMFQNTLNRANKLACSDISIDKIIIVTNEKHRFLVLKQSEALNIIHNIEIILEPVPKNTAPALTIASYASDEDSVMIVMPADHDITREDLFIDSVMKSAKACEHNTIHTFGIKPTDANVGYGYIYSKNDGDLSLVREFIEKPEPHKAELMVKDDNYSWNSGIFIMHPSTWIEAISKSNKKIHDLSQQAWSSKQSDEWFVRPERESFELLQSDSIDYAVMEKFDTLGIRVLVSILNAGWDDMGSFLSFKNQYAQDDSGNTFVGNVSEFEAKDNIAISTSRNISLVNVDNLVVVETKDSILVSNIKNAKNVRSIVQVHTEAKNDIVDQHTKVFTPWGWYEELDQGETFKVKKILIEPGKSISLQRHKHRSEHWVVIKGKASVTKGSDTFTLCSNESIYIEKEEIHRLENKSADNLEIIEVQSGTTLLESDIERLEDKYGR